MSTSALITMITVQLLVAAITLYFIIRVLVQQNNEKNSDSSGQF